MQTSAKLKNPLLSSLLSRLGDLPPRLTIPQVANALKENLPTIRAQISRGTFPLTVRQIKGGNQHVMLADLLLWIANGEVQPQVPLIKRPSRNPLGKRGRGRPTNKSKKLDLLGGLNHEG